MEREYSIYYTVSDSFAFEGTTTLQHLEKLFMNFGINSKSSVITVWVATGEKNKVKYIMWCWNMMVHITLLSRFLGHLNMYTSPRKYDLLSAQFTQLPRDNTVLYGQSVLEDKSKRYLTMLMHCIQLK